jgi:uncharacterized Zn-binding protein involved in type VI secretion
MTFYIGNKQVARQNVSTAGGTLDSPAASSFYFMGNKVSLDGDSVTSHGMYNHASATVIANPTVTFFINNIKVVVDGDSATCSHTVSA